MDLNAMRFRPDGMFRILQVSDPQDLVHARKAMLRMLDRAYDTLQPDLVLFTGDNTLGNHLLDVGPFRIETLGRSEITLRQLRRALKNILAPVEARAIPFAMIYGNHDDMNDVSKEAQFALYRAYAHCLPMNGSGADVDCDTYRIPILSADGQVRWNLWMLDSARNDGTGQHWQITEETVRWYERESARLAEENGGKPVPSLLFIHVPLPEIRGLLQPCEAETPGSVRTENGFFRLDPAKAQGTLGEPVSPCEAPCPLFGAVKRRGDVRAVISGHDHSNCFDGETDGVRMIQSGAASFRCYGSRVRGVRLFVLRENEPDRFETRYYTYDDLCGTGVRARLRYFWDADDKARQKYALLGGMTTAALTAAAAIGIRIRHGS